MKQVQKFWAVLNVFLDVILKNGHEILDTFFLKSE